MKLLLLLWSLLLLYCEVATNNDRLAKKQNKTQTHHLTAWISHDDTHSRNLASYLVAQQANKAMVFFKES